MKPRTNEAPQLMAMARRIARQVVIEEMKKNGLRMSLVEVGEVVRASNMLLAACREKFIAEASARLCSISH